MSQSEGLNPFEPPKSEWSREREVPESSDELVDATGRTRFANYVIDTTLHTGLTLAVASVEGDGLATLGVMFGYYVFFESLFGRSPAKWLTRTRVVTNAGGRPRFAQILGRSLSRLVPFEPLSFLGRSRGWHDRWSGTRVIEDPRPGEGPRRRSKRRRAEE